VLVGAGHAAVNENEPGLASQYGSGEVHIATHVRAQSSCCVSCKKIELLLAARQLKSRRNSLGERPVILRKATLNELVCE